ncbi:uncharacterized protein TM35_000801000 [Trypanosoma theileri]|uniref:Uncharacterized protein n=1 Tax=Trypanosoma theileri TaxID=67003 RepID=A0A1X0NFL5_9TRYP|nr:uncharacterized protein TM35_000801000 [Trypanosoma theileri]ORC82962.1 hypothetical protein TM35_000801000 [Trypanosoma theileri]
MVVLELIHEKPRRKQPYEQQQGCYHAVGNHPHQTRPQSQSYRTPVRRPARHDGSSQTRRRCTDEANTNIDVDFHTLTPSRLTTHDSTTTTILIIAGDNGRLGAAIIHRPHTMGSGRISTMLAQGDSQEMGIRAPPPLNPPNKK